MRTVRCSGYLGMGVGVGGLSTGAVQLPLWTEWQTGVKTLPFRNFVCDGNYTSFTDSVRLVMPTSKELFFEFQQTVLKWHIILQKSQQVLSVTD